MDEEEFSGFWCSGKGIIYCEDCSYKEFCGWSWQVDPVPSCYTNKYPVKCESCPRSSPADFPIKYTRAKFYGKVSRDKIFNE